MKNTTWWKTYLQRVVKNNLYIYKHTSKMLLDRNDLIRLWTNAHRWTSFSPEKRGESTASEYMEMITSDIAKFDNDEAKESYCKKFNSLFMARLSAKSRCISSMITWPAKFPTARAQKYSNAEMKAWEELEKFRKKWESKPRATAEEQAESLPVRLAKLEAMNYLLSINYMTKMIYQWVNM